MVLVCPAITAPKWDKYQIEPSMCFHWDDWTTKQKIFLNARTASYGSDQQNALSTLFYIPDRTNAHDWLLLLWLPSIPSHPIRASRILAMVHFRGMTCLFFAQGSARSPNYFPNERRHEKTKEASGCVYKIHGKEAHVNTDKRFTPNCSFQMFFFSQPHSTTVLKPTFKQLHM